MDPLLELAARLGEEHVASVRDRHVGCYSCSPAMATVEEVAGGWARELLGLPTQASHGFTTGCQMAHVTGLAVARRVVLARAGWDVDERGLHGAPPVRIVVPEDRHIMVDAAVRLLGLGLANLRAVPCDDQGRVIAEGLERELAREPD